MQMIDIPVIKERKLVCLEVVFRVCIFQTMAPPSPPNDIIFICQMATYKGGAMQGWKAWSFTHLVCPLHSPTFATPTPSHLETHEAPIQNPIVLQNTV